jgi:hypothetical protein
MTEFLVKWEGYSDDHNTWEPEEILKEDSFTEEMLQAYQAKNFAHFVIIH